MSAARKEMEKERAEMLSEIARMDAVRKGGDALEQERRAHERTKSEGREVRALADEREKRNLWLPRESSTLPV